MGERLDRVIAILETLADGVRRGADALERLATAPSGRLPEARRAQRRVARVQPPAVDELAGVPYDPADRPDRVPLYVGKANDVGRRLRGHPRLTDLYMRWSRIGAMRITTSDGAGGLVELPPEMRR